MAWPGFSDTLASMVMGDLLCFCSLAASHPLHLAYLLFFSPYLLAALSFLGPLLVSTCFLLLALLTVSPYLTGGAPPPPPDGVPSPPGPFGNTLRLVLDMLDPWADGEPGVPPPGVLCGIALELQACADSVEELYRERGEAMVGSANPGRIPRDDGEEEQEEEEEEEKRIVVEATIPPSNELFGWELEAISKLYRALTYEVEEFPVKLAALRSFKEGNDLFPPPGTGFHGGPQEEDLPRKEAPPPCPKLESRDRKLPTCDDCENVDIPLGDASKPAIKSRDCQLSARGVVSEAEEADGLVGDDNSSPAPLKGATTPRSRVEVPSSDSDGSKQQLLPLRRSSSSSSASRAAGGSLARMASAGEWRGSGSSRSLSSSGSMRKEKEWRRTLACKLYEERVVADSGEEGMDLLWETYELGSGRDGNSSDKGKEEDKAKAANKGGGKHAVEEEDDGGEEEEEGEEEMVGRLCCLQALRFSTAKMSFGMGRSGLLKVTKAMKGAGVFRRALRGSRKGRE